MKVHHITPGRSDLNYGKSINDIIYSLPDEDWICLRDIDTIPLHHRVFFKQCEEIAESGEYDLVSCMTNRLGVGYQLYEGKMSDNWDIEHHVKIAHELYNDYGSEVEEPPNTVLAGVMMLFSRETWVKAGEFPEGGVFVDGRTIDITFTKKVLKTGGKIGIAKGIYLFHLYRNWEQHPRLNNSHLSKRKKS